MLQVLQGLQLGRLQQLNNLIPQGLQDFLQTGLQAVLQTGLQVLQPRAQLLH